MAMTREDIAKEHARRKLARAGLDAQGNPSEADSEVQENDILEQPASSAEEVQEEDTAPQTNPFEARVQQLELQLAAANGRVGPTQAELEDYRRANTELRQQLSSRETNLQQEIQRLQSELEDRNAQVNLEELLDPDEREAFDPALLSVVTKVADAIAKKRAPKVDVRAETLKLLQERDTARVNEYRNRVLTDPTRGLHQLASLSQDQRFHQWTADDENDMEGPVRMLLAATSTEEIDRYQRIISRKIDKFKTTLKTPASRQESNPADAASRIAAGMRRNPESKMSEAEVQAKLNEAKRLSRSSSRADRAKAQSIINSLS
ncbi:hypothetical protein RF55_2316 [Lasius niger]|uniref:Uncharacterized protein n=1 Tax=Lasius niger TaxID=67767 RepID=A0A0J7L454_LASNI|nr:hypothetical protein RF55_2316 [Lasius niger]